jgi:adenylate cyclase
LHDWRGDLVWPGGSLFLLLVGLAALRLADPILVQELRVRVFDFFQVLHPRDATQRPVVIVDIDEKSLNSLGQWPWPRTRIADIITRLTQMGALVVAFDVVFAEPDRMSPGIAAIPSATLTRRRGRSCARCRATTADTCRCLSKIARLWSVNRAFLRSGRSRQCPAADRYCNHGCRRAAVSTNFPGLLRNVPTLEQAASGRGLFTIRPERDGIIRRVPVVMQAQGAIMPSLTLEMLRVVSGSNTVLIRSDHAGVQSAAIPDS